MRLILAAGTTRTAEIEGISAAGADPELLVHTPAADAEILAYGDVVRAPSAPVSPTGCPTPAAITRAAREVVGFETTVVDAGLAVDTAAPTVEVGAGPGGDVRTPEPVPDAAAIRRRARELGRELPDDEVLVAETVPGGTTTALGALRALGEDAGVSSSLPANPLDRKRAVVAAGLAGSGLEPGDLAGDPVAAIRRMGDPVQALVVGLAEGAVEAGADLTLAGGTQMLAVCALLAHAGVDPPRVATTSFVADDPTVDPRGTAADLGADLVVTDPGFDGADHPAMARYAAGEAREGVGMGGALWLADRRDALPAVRDRIRTVADRLGVESGAGDRPATGDDGDPPGAGADPTAPGEGSRGP